MVCILEVGVRQHWLCWARVLQIPQLSHLQDLLGSPKLPMTLSPPMILSLFLKYVWQEEPVGLHCGDSCQPLDGGGAERARKQAYGRGGLMGGAGRPS